MEQIKASLPLEELSFEITRNAVLVSQYLHSEGFPQPSHDADGPSSTIPRDSPQSIRVARQNLIEASLKMFQLALGPTEYLPNLATGFQYLSCLSWLCHYNIFHIVPLEGTIGYEKVAAIANVSEQRLKSIARMAMTNGLFREPIPGQLAHSATSSFLTRNPDAYAWATFMCSKSAPTAMTMVDAHERWGPNTVKKNETAYNVAFETELPFFDHLSLDESEVSRFAAYMRNVTSSEGVNVKHLVAGFDWESLGNGKVVDVGGSTGGAAIALARAYPRLNFVVQDLDANAKQGQENAASLPGRIRSRIAFQGHDFTQPEPVKDADVYLLRMILHDWPDNEAIKILNNIIPAMEKPGSRLLIMDSVLPHPGTVPVSLERIIRVRDLTMMQSFNSKERSLDDWQRLLDSAKGNLRLVNVSQPFGSAMSILEVSLGS
ncbi:sterigmatocystin 8-O-methyltransferase [Nemania sp. FL0031]|nr:sterigmatocystin 8-O-methyltransferase [Nemania sp. FL0031]